MTDWVKWGCDLVNFLGNKKKKINYKNISALRMIIAHFDKKENYSRQVHTAIPVFWKKELDTE